MWFWRLSIWALSCAASVARFHSPIGFPWTLNAFAVAVFFWLERELRYFQVNRSSRLLEFGGLCAYSIYLCHTVFPTFLSRFHFPNLGPNLNWMLATILNLGLCLLFYFIIEKPSHMLARKFGR